MKQALHILKKDVRHLRWELAALLLFLAVFAYTQLHRSILRVANAATMSMVLLCFWAFLCARLIQAESIPGDRQFWITRPYEWRSLLGAKLLFMIAFIGVPLVVADAVILGAQGFSVASYSVGLLWSLILITASTLIGFCAFATLTRGLAQWMLAGMIAVGVGYAIAAIANETVWGGVEWIRECGAVAIMFVTAVVVLLRQYKRRGMAASIAVMAAGWLGSAFFVNYSRSAWAYDLEARFSKPKVDPSSLRIVVRPVPQREEHRSLERREQVILISIPIDISGLGQGLDLISDEVDIAVTNENGRIWSANGRRANGSNYLQHLPSGYRLLLQVNRSAFEKANGRPVDLNMTLYLTMLRDSASRVVGRSSGAVDVPGAGRCRFEEEGDSWIVCESPLRAPPNVLVVELGGERRDRFLTGTSYSPFPADADSAMTPLGRYSHSGPRDAAPATVTSLEPVAHFRRDLNLPNVYLTDYRVLSPF